MNASAVKLLIQFNTEHTIDCGIRGKLLSRHKIIYECDDYYNKKYLMKTHRVLGNVKLRAISNLHSGCRLRIRQYHGRDFCLAWCHLPKFPKRKTPWSVRELVSHASATNTCGYFVNVCTFCAYFAIEMYCKHLVNYSVSVLWNWKVVVFDCFVVAWMSNYAPKFIIT